jgi:hypothetical protein
MNNAEDILKKILLNMKYDPKKTIKEQSSISDNTKKSDPGNYSLDERKLISCVDGSEYVSPYITILSKFEPNTSQSWTDWNTNLLSENKPNALTACKYQSTIKVQQKRTELSYDDEVVDCINLSYQSFNNKPMFCATHFSFYDKSLDDGSDNVKRMFREIFLTAESWFLSEYRKYQENNNYKTREPYETSFIVKSYNVWNGKSYEPFTLSSINDNEKDINVERKQMSVDVDVDQHFLPLTNAEKGQFKDIPLTKNDEFKNSGKYICKNSDKSMVNLRTSAAVNTDTGFFDPADNYINWTGDEIIGEYLGEKWSYIQYATGSEFGGTTPNAKLAKWMKSLNDNDVIEIYKSLGGSVPEGKMQNARSSLSGILNSVDGNKKPALDVIPKKYRDSIVKFDVSHKWYHVKFLKPYKDQTDNDTYDNGWVRSDNVNFCLPTTDKNSQTNYRLEYLKRLPMKPFKDPAVLG